MCAVGSGDLGVGSQRELTKWRMMCYILCHVRRSDETASVCTCVCVHMCQNCLDFFADSSFVLTYYKTEQCRRPPRLCRQGYACPFFHNNKDRRRSPKCYKYRYVKKQY